MSKRKIDIEKDYIALCRTFVATFDSSHPEHHIYSRFLAAYDSCGKLQAKVERLERERAVLISALSPQGCPPRPHSSDCNTHDDCTTCWCKYVASQTGEK
jgi:hypothetical protein